MNTAVKTEDTVQITINWTEYNRLMFALNEQLYALPYETVQDKIRYKILLELYKKLYMTRKVSEGKWENC